VDGFRAAIEARNANEAKPIEIVAVLDGGGKKDRGARATEDLLQSYPDLNGIFAINDPSALGALSVLEKVRKTDQVVLIGFDGQPDGKQAIKDGKIFGDPIQFPDKMGVEIVQAIVRHLKGEELQKEILIPTYLYRQSDALQDASLNNPDAAPSPAP
jgi:ribose transport system substrate-binding protein